MKTVKPFNPEKALSLQLLEKVLDRINVKNFNNNDAWQDFVISIIATSGNSEEVLDIIEAWSRKDPDYCNGYCHLMPCPKTLRPVKIVRGVPVEVVRRSRLIYPRQRRDRSE